MNVTSAVAVNPAVYMPVQTTIPLATQSKTSTALGADTFVNDGAQRHDALYNEFNANNYANATTTSQRMPRMVFPDGSSVSKQNKYTAPLLEEFYSNRGSVDNVIKHMMEEFDTWVSVNIRNGSLDIDDKDAMRFILDRVYLSMLSGQNHWARRAMQEQGLQLGKITLNDIAAGGLYYNSDFYYMAEEAFAAIKETFFEIAVRYDLGDNIKPPEPNHENQLLSSFNAAFTHQMKDTSLVPPRGFEMVFEPFKYKVDSPEAYDNVHRLVAYDLKNPNTENPGIAFYIGFPRGINIFRPDHFIDLNLFPHLRFGADPLVKNFDFSPLVMEYMRPGMNVIDATYEVIFKYFINPYAGAVQFTSNGITVNHDIVFCYYRHNYLFDAKDIVQRNDGWDDETNKFVQNFKFWKTEYHATTPHRLLT
jgi:hypothetical protein